MSEEERVSVLGERQSLLTTRRESLRSLRNISVSWLVYLNDDWSVSNGGELRCYERKFDVEGKVGATEEGDLQVGWLAGEKERAVFLDARGNGYGNMVRLFVGRKGGGRMLRGNFRLIRRCIWLEGLGLGERENYIVF